MAKPSLMNDNAYESAYGPASLARRFASYIKDPSTLRARVMDHYGTAPSLSSCARIIAEESRVPRTHYSRKIEGYSYSNFTCDHPRNMGNVHIEPNGEASCATCRQPQPEEPKPAPRPAPRVVVKPTIPAWYVPRSERPRLHTDTLKAVADAFHITVDELKGPGRARDYVDARAVVVHILRQAGLSFPRIAQILNRSCHTTIINLWETWDHRIKRNPTMAELSERLGR